MEEEHVWGEEGMVRGLVAGPSNPPLNPTVVHEFTPTGPTHLYNSRNFPIRDADGCIIVYPETRKIIDPHDHSWAKPLLPVVSDPDEVIEWEDKFASGTDHWRSIVGNTIALRGYKENVMASVTLASYHIIFKVVGKEEMIELFHSILWEIDKDYPLSPGLKLVDTLTQCTHCKGLLWERTAMSPEMVKKLARQLGVQCKIRSWKLGSKCKGNPPTEKITMKDWLKRDGR